MKTEGETRECPIIAKKWLIGIGVAVLVFLVGIRFLAPTKTFQEIQDRQAFKRLIYEADRWVTHGKFDKALEILHKASRLVPNQFIIYLRMAELYDFKTDYEEAGKYYLKYLKVFNSNPSVWLHFSRNLNRQGKIDAAKKHEQYSYP